MTPYDPRAAALNALAAMRFPDASEPPAEQVEAVEAYFRAAYKVGAAMIVLSPRVYVAWRAGREGRPLVPPV